MTFASSPSRRAPTSHEGRGELTAEVRPSAHPKCGRCWHYRPDVGSIAAHPGLCGRCVANLEGAGEARVHA